VNRSQQPGMPLYRPAPRPPRRRSSCVGVLVFLGGLAILLGAVLIIVIGSGFQRPGGVSSGLGTNSSGPGASEQRARQTTLSPQQNIEQQVQTKAPDAVAALPTGEVTVSEAQVNAFLASNIAQLEPLEQATVHFTPGQITIDLVAMGTENRMTMGVALANGRVTVVNAQMEGPLGMVVSADELAGQFEQELNRQLGVQGRTVQHVAVQEGQLVVVVE
jgi:hypothetical protein